MKNKRGNVAVIGLIIVIVVITTGVITWLIATKSQAPVQQAVLTQPTAPVTQTQPVVATQPVNETANWQTYANTKLGFTIKYPSDWTYVNQNDGADFYEGYLFPKAGNESISKSKNPALEIGKVLEHLDFGSLIMTPSNFKNFDPRKYVVAGVGPYEEELLKFEEKTTLQGGKVYFYTTKIKDKGLDETKEGALFVNDKQRKISFVERKYSMNGSKMSDNLRKKLQEIAISFSDTQN